MSIQYLKTLPTDQFQKTEFANKAIMDIIDGAVNPLEILTLKKHIEDVLERIVSDPQVIAAIDTEMGKYSEKETITHMGYKIERGQRRNFDYSVCGDAFYEELKKASKQKADEAKEREKFLQSLKQKMVDAENGGFEIAPPAITYTSYFKLTEQKVDIELPKESGLPF